MSLPAPAPIRPVVSRDEAGEFAERTLKNYRFMKAARAFQGADVHLITHLANSLLGLVVFPWEDDFVAPLAARPLSGLMTVGGAWPAGQQWPRWTIHLGAASTSTLGDLLYHIRNAVAHRRLRFSSDSPVLRDVNLTIEDFKPKATQAYWRASINCEDLETFCELLAYEISELR